MEKQLKDTEKEVKKEVDEATAKAKESPLSDPSQLFTNVYVKGFGVVDLGSKGVGIFSTAYTELTVQEIGIRNIEGSLKFMWLGSVSASSSISFLSLMIFAGSDVTGPVIYQDNTAGKLTEVRIDAGIWSIEKRIESCASIP
ncbi:hypothetical protein Pfo_024111 [Paulownia fortunei]|nr:hypothetical protein Pfo_024111 [Paulownia fortunei]